MIDGPLIRTAESTREPFERGLKDFQKRLEEVGGYKFRNENILRRMFTRATYHMAQRKSADAGNIQDQMEADGDNILDRKIQEWLGRTKKESRGTGRHDFFNSDVFLSTLALRLGMNECLRMDIVDARAEEPEAKADRLAGTFEAMIKGIVDDQGGDETALNNVLNKMIFDAPRTKDLYVGLCSTDERAIMRAFGVVTKKRAIVQVEERDVRKRKQIVKDYTVSIRMGEEIPVEGLSKPYQETIPVSVNSGGRIDGIRKAVLVFLKQNPWLLWEFEGNAGIHYPVSIHRKPRRVTQSG